MVTSSRPGSQCRSIIAYYLVFVIIITVVCPAIVLMGEPTRWESALQIIIDLLRSDGKPDALQSDEYQPRVITSKQQLPVVACNMDLQFKDRAASSRYHVTLH